MGVTGAERYAYGEDPSQYGDLYRPQGRARPGTLVVLHGGFWRAAFGADHLAGVSADLSARGWTVWNVEYRRLGNGGGATTTLADVSAAIDHLRGISDVDAGRVVAVGHSAGGHLAVWAAGRRELAAAGLWPAPTVEVHAVVSLAGVLDLAAAVREGIGGGAAVEFLGGIPEERPEPFALADPLARIPLSAVVRCVHARPDDRVPFAQSETYVARARAAGMDAALVEAVGDHFSVADAGSSDWPVVLGALEEMGVPRPVSGDESASGDGVGATVVRRLSRGEADLSERVASLIARAYQGAQEELFTSPVPRTSAEAVARLIRAGEMVVAENGRGIVGVVVTRAVDTRVGYVEMLAVAPEATSRGVARQILDAVEATGAARGLETMELDLLVPETPTPHQSRLRAWYERRGYVPVRERPFEDVEPTAAAFLRHPTRLVRLAKALGRRG